MKYTIAVPDGSIVADAVIGLFRGDSSLVEKLNRLTTYPAVRLESGEYAPISWSGESSIRLALELVEPRFAGEWRDRLPPEIRTAPKPILEPAGPAPFGVVH